MARMVGLKWTLSTLHPPTSLRIFKHVISTRWWANPNRGCRNFSSQSLKLIWVSYSILEWNFFLGKGSYYKVPNIRWLLNQLYEEQVTVWAAHHPMSFKHVIFTVFVLESMPNWAWHYFVAINYFIILIFSDNNFTWVHHVEYALLKE